ncbi:MAG: hypothetical protein IPM74_11055 [Crocinitomicaceae bacterium]|nr:hypothetical protein [Crocinitomicaceae bacterium]MBK8926421.1 hypothetical protein [Crocinitomicaceae bacterium]
MKKNIIFIVSLSFLFSGCEDEPETVDYTSTIVGTWESYAWYGIDIESDGTICNEDYVAPNPGIKFTFEEDGTFIMDSGAQGTWSFNNVNMTISTSILIGGAPNANETIYLNKKEIPWNSHETPSATESPTIFVNWDGSLGSASNCQYYKYSQRRFKKI